MKYINCTIGLLIMLFMFLIGMLFGYIKIGFNAGIYQVEKEKLL